MDFLTIRLNSGCRSCTKLGLLTSQTVSRKHSFKTLTNAKLDIFKRRQLKQRTLTKVKWAVRAYNE